MSSVSSKKNQNDQIRTERGSSSNLKQKLTDGQWMMDDG